MGYFQNRIDTWWNLSSALHLPLSRGWLRSARNHPSHSKSGRRTNPGDIFLILLPPTASNLENVNMVVFDCTKSWLKVHTIPFPARCHLYGVREPVALETILGFASRVGSFAFGPSSTSLEHRPRAGDFQGSLLGYSLMDTRGTRLDQNSKLYIDQSPWLKTLRWSRFHLMDNADLHCKQERTGGEGTHRNNCKNIPTISHLDIWPCRREFHQIASKSEFTWGSLLDLPFPWKERPFFCLSTRWHVSESFGTRK